MQLTHLDGLIFHREGGLQLTTRFRQDEGYAISPDDWKEGSRPVSICFSSGSLLQSTALVRELKPRAGDATGRYFTDTAGNNHWVPLPSYGLVNPQAYLAFLRTQIPEQTRCWAAQQSEAHKEALRLLDAGQAPELQTLLHYDFARYQKTRSAYLTGTNTLGIPPLPSTALTFPGHPPLPRVITAQCDAVSSVYLAGLLAELFGEESGSLCHRLRSQTPRDTHIGYVALRILAQGTVWVMVDKHRRDLQNGTDDHALERQLQTNLNCLVSHFNAGHLGIPYADVLCQLPPEALAFYRSIDHEKLPGSEMDAWKSTLFWLPALPELLARPYKERHVFGSH